MEALIAQTTFGTKTDVARAPQSTPSASPVNGLQMFQMLIALGLVAVLLKFGLPKLIAKFGKRLSPRGTSSIDLLESAAFGAGQIQVVKVRGRTLLLGVTAQNVTCLADMTEYEDTLADQEPAFFEMLDRHAEEPIEMPTMAVVEMPVPDIEPDESPAAAASADEISIAEAHRLLMAAKNRSTEVEPEPAPAVEEDVFAALKRLEKLAQ